MDLNEQGGTLKTRASSESVAVELTILLLREMHQSIEVDQPEVALSFLALLRQRLAELERELKAQIRTRS